MSILGIIPAAGESKRWGGGFKELLPIEENIRVIDRVINSMKIGNANKILIVTNQNKISAHIYHLKDRPSLFFSTQKLDLDLYGAVYESLTFACDLNLFAMPDTIFPMDCFNRNFSGHDLWLGCFRTDKPENFGVVHKNKIYDKCKDLKGTIQIAWGVLVWSKRVADFWLDNNFKTNDDALSKAMAVFGYEFFMLEYYYDLATMNDYLNYIT